MTEFEKKVLGTVKSLGEHYHERVKASIGVMNVGDCQEPDLHEWVDDEEHGSRLLNCIDQLVDEGLYNGRWRDAARGVIRGEHPVCHNCLDLATAWVAELNASERGKRAAERLAVMGSLLKIQEEEQ